jgi:cell wall-associated NlpC family hydrolase
MANFGQKIDKEHAQKGDLIFFATFGGKRVSHVGMVTEVAPDGEIKFIHSASSSGVIVSSIKENYYTKTFVQINRVLLD